MERSSFLERCVEPFHLEQLLGDFLDLPLAAECKDIQKIWVLSWSKFVWSHLQWPLHMQSHSKFHLVSTQVNPIKVHWLRWRSKPRRPGRRGTSASLSIDTVLFWGQLHGSWCILAPSFTLQWRRLAKTMLSLTFVIDCHWQKLKWKSLTIILIKIIADNNWHWQLRPRVTADY